MFRFIGEFFLVLALALALTLAGCVPSGGFGPPAAAECRDELAAHCKETCTVEGAFTVGYLSVYPFASLKCVCKPINEGTPGPAPKKPGVVF